MKHKNLPPDDRLDWRDPNMPVMRFELKGKKTIAHFVAPNVAKEYYEFKMTNSDNHAPLWNNDPSYNWGKGKRNGRYK